MPDQATRNSNTEQVSTRKSRTRAQKNLKNSLLEPKLEMLKQKSSLIHVRIQQFETIKSELDLALQRSYPKRLV